MELFNAHLVLIIFRKALIEFNRVTIWALPVELSVTVIAGQEKERNWSNDSNRCPHDLSYLFGQNERSRGFIGPTYQGMLYVWKYPINAEYT